jgi:hypothetical protein
MSFGTEFNWQMSYRFIGGEGTHSAACLHLGGADILFKADQPIEVGKALEIHLSLDQTGGPPMTAFIEVTRSNPADDGTYEIAALIKGIKGN